MIKSVYFFASYFRNMYLKTGKTTFIKIEQVHGGSIYNKVLYSEHHKNIYLRDIYYVKLSHSG